MIKTGNGRIVTIQESLVVVHNNLKSLSLFMSGICTFDEIISVKYLVKLS